MLRFVYVIILTSFLIGCKEKIVRYKYKGTTLTRKDEDAVTYLYYGDYPEGSRPNSYIKVSYSGFSNCMGAFLIFNKNGTVEVKSSGCGEFSYSRKVDKKLYMIDYENVEYIKWADSIKNKFGNIIWISDIPEMEKHENQKNHSKVETIYSCRK